jgi:hypothetical protein
MVMKKKNYIIVVVVVLVVGGAIFNGVRERQREQERQKKAIAQVNQFLQAAPKFQVSDGPIHIPGPNEPSHRETPANSPVNK